MTVESTQGICSAMHSANTIRLAASGSTPHLRDTQEAFDSVAADYDGPRGNNDQIQDMRRDMWQSLDTVFPRACRLIDLGCGTGLDAVRMAKLGHLVTAADWSPGMVQRTC